jgi:cell division protease FtsH
VHLAKVRVDPALDLRKVAARTPGFVGADLANVVNEAALLAARRNREHVVFEDFDEAVDRVSIGLERRSQVIGDEEKRIIAFHEAGHAITAAFCAHADPVHKVTIIPRGLTGGVTISTRDKDRHLTGEAMLRDMLVTGLGGRAAEELVLGETSTGAYNDIQQVSRIARGMVTELGMSRDLGPINYEGGPRTDAFGFPMVTGRQWSDETARRIDDEVRRLIDEALGRARTILSEHRAELERLAERLLDVETVERGELYEMLGLPQPVDTHAGPPEIFGVPEEPSL